MCIVILAKFDQIVDRENTHNSNMANYVELNKLYEVEYVESYNAYSQANVKLKGINVLFLSDHFSFTVNGIPTNVNELPNSRGVV